MDVDKVNTVLTHLNKLNNVVDCSKENMYEKLTTEVDANLLRINTIGTKVLNTSGLVSKTKYNSEIKILKKRLKKLIRRYLIQVKED